MGSGPGCERRGEGARGQKVPRSPGRTAGCGSRGLRPQRTNRSGSGSGGEGRAATGVGRLPGGRAGLGPGVRESGAPGGDVTIGEWEGRVRGREQPAKVANGRGDCDVREASYLATTERIWHLGGM